MGPLQLLLIGLCVLLETIEQALFRQGSAARLRNWATGLGMTLNIVGMGVWLVVLQTVQLGQAMPLLAANNVTVALAGMWLFGERVTRRRWIGIGLITAGVALVASESA